MKKIFLSPSAQNRNTYAAGNTNERVQCERIAAAAETALKRCGFEVINGAGMASYTERVETAKAQNVDLYMPIHTNAFNGKVTGTRMFVRKMTEEPSITYCRKIFKYLDAVCPGTSSNIKTYAKLWEFRLTDGIPAVYAECEFHDVPTMALWIIEHVVDIGEAIAHGICDCFDVEYIEPPKPEPAFKIGDRVRLRVGAKNYTGTTTFRSWVYRMTLYVRQVNGDRVVVSVFRIGAVTGAVNAADLVKI